MPKYVTLEWDEYQRLLDSQDSKKPSLEDIVNTASSPIDIPKLDPFMPDIEFRSGVKFAQGAIVGRLRNFALNTK